MMELLVKVSQKGNDTTQKGNDTTEDPLLKDSQ